MSETEGNVKCLRHLKYYRVLRLKNNFGFDCETTRVIKQFFEEKKIPITFRFVRRTFVI